jgi:hypothetical protein
MPQDPLRPDPPPPPEQPAQDAQAGRKPAGISWSSLVEQRIRQAQERGEFDNLSNAGKPVEIDENPMASDRALAYSILKSHNVAPPEIELGKEVDDLLTRAEALKSELRSRRNAVLSLRHRTAAHTRTYNDVLARYAVRFANLVREARSKVLSLNIIAPAAFHRTPVDAQKLIDEFNAEFPPLSA